MSDEKFDLSYSTLWKSIIRPPRDEYYEENLGDNYFEYKGKKYVRKDYDVLNKQGLILKCSMIEPEDESRTSEEMPVVIYLHGNSSSRLEGMKAAPQLLLRGINIFVLDFAGCGLSEGEYISLGWNERDDVDIIVDFINKIPGVGKIGLWGRSMGASTILMYGGLNKKISSICLDSPFCEFRKLAKELCNKQISLPDFILDTALSIVNSTIKSKNGVDINKLNPISYSPKIKIPGFFIHAKEDELIPVDHSIAIFEVYEGEKSLVICEGTHNSGRQKHILEKIGKFFSKYLLNIDEDEHLKI